MVKIIYLIILLHSIFIYNKSNFRYYGTIFFRCYQQI
uniref:Uncharacterized protein n=1 Tax=viral metagenome TaxID=1070528 RepID=A0A6C0H8P5_9ZZZZ